MVFLSTHIEIAASPEKVRDVFLDFPNFSSWAIPKSPDQASGISKIEIAETGTGTERKTTGHTLQPGDVVNTFLGGRGGEGEGENGKSTGGMKFSPVILVNTPSEFKWRGSLPYIFTGEHSFQFLPSEKIPGGTKFVNEEQFSGALAFVMGGMKWAMGEGTKKGFEALNGGLKRRMEMGEGK